MAAAAPPVVEAISDFNRGRKRSLLGLKYKLMAADPFAFFRGTDHLFARDWAELRPPDPGPGVLCCGDLHLENFGAYRAENGRFLFDVNDFDEAVIAPSGMDLTRCTTSILLAAEEWGLTPMQANRMALTFLDSYRAAVTRAEEEGAVGSVDTRSARGPIQPLLSEAAQGTQAELLDAQAPRVAGGGRRISPRGGKHPALGRRRFAMVVEAVEAYGKGAPGSTVLDATGRIVGVGSLGVRRYLVLIEGEGGPDGNLLLDVKEATPSALLGCPGVERPDWPGDEAERVVEAQRCLQASPAAGLGTLDFDDRVFRARVMVPAENRADLDRLRRDPRKLRRAVRLAGTVAAWSNYRGAWVAGADRTADLARWAAGAPLDSILAAAARYAERVRRDHRLYRRAYDAGQLDPRPG